jgi:hypothetical protein
LSEKTSAKSARSWTLLKIILISCRLIGGALCESDDDADEAVNVDERDDSGVSAADEGLPDGNGAGRPVLL